MADLRQQLHNPQDNLEQASRTHFSPRDRIMIDMNEHHEILRNTGHKVIMS